MKAVNFRTDIANLVAFGEKAGIDRRFSCGNTVAYTYRWWRRDASGRILIGIHLEDEGDGWLNVAFNGTLYDSSGDQECRCKADTNAVTDLIRWTTMFSEGMITRDKFRGYVGLSKALSEADKADDVARGLCKLRIAYAEEKAKWYEEVVEVGYRKAIWWENVARYWRERLNHHVNKF